MGKRSKALGVSIIVGIIGIVFVVIGFIVKANNDKFIDNAYAVEATVVSTHSGSNSSYYGDSDYYDSYNYNDNSYTIFEFVPKGQTEKVIVKSSCYSAFVQAGSTKTIYVSNTDYNNIYFPEVENTLFYIFVAIGFICIGIAVIYFAVKFSSGKKLEKFKAEGKHIRAKITKIEVDYNTSIGNGHPLRVICEADDGFSNKKYMSSKTYIHEINFTVGDSIDVYELDEEYVVDIKGYLDNK